MVGRRFLNMPMIGTNTMYIAVRKPDLPASVSTRPTCCRLQARNKGSPQRSPAVQSFLSAQRRMKLLPSCLNRSEIRMTGSKPRTAIKHRMVWKVKGPMWSMPILWDTKAEPQITVAKTRQALHSNFFLIYNHRGILYHNWRFFASTMIAFLPLRGIIELNQSSGG